MYASGCIVYTGHIPDFKKGRIAMPPEYAMNRLKRGVPAVISSLSTVGAMRRRLLDIGFTPGSPVPALFRSCSGDPVAYLICGSVIALRSEDAATIMVRSA